MAFNKPALKKILSAVKGGNAQSVSGRQNLQTFFGGTFGKQGKAFSALFDELKKKKKTLLGS